MNARIFWGLLGGSILLITSASSLAAEPLPGTKPLEEKADLARLMVDGIHKYLDRELVAAPQQRDELWKADFLSREALAKALPAKRDRLRKMLGVVDERVKPNLEYISGPGKPSLLGTVEGCQVHAVRWAVLPGVDAEGLLIEPSGPAKAFVVAVPDVFESPERIAGLQIPREYGLHLASAGCRVLLPVLIDRNDDLSANARLGIKTNIPHREFLWRMAFEMGRTPVGLEVQKVLAGVDWFALQDKSKPIGVIGSGEGGMIALYAAALDERIRAASVLGHFAPRETLPAQPIDRSIWGLLGEFGDAEVAAMVHPRPLFLDPGWAEMRPPQCWPQWAGPIERLGFNRAAPGKLEGYGYGESDELRELARLDKLLGVKRQPPKREKGSDVWLPQDFLNVLAPGAKLPLLGRNPDKVLVESDSLIPRHKRQFDQLVAFNQKLWRDSDAVRKDFWKKADSSSPQKWEASCDSYREYFHTEVIGKLPEPKLPLNPRSRPIYDEKEFLGYEVVLDVYEDVIAQGILLLPKDLKPGEKRPVVVCQHGLEGRPQDVCNPKEKTRAYASYGAELARKGYIVYAPQNPYIFQNHFRQIQRKANPLKLSLFSFIVRQHQRTLDWLETLPNVDAKKIGFYGLSYGGKTAMRVPAIEKRYCLSICSGDFNEWIGKIVSVELDRSYMWTGEYEMMEFNLGHTFDYAEMAYLIAPRPFVVERGHDDGVGIDEMVASEYAKVRYLYANKLKIADRTTIDFQPGGHEIFLKGTLEFLEKHLGKPR